MVKSLFRLCDRYGQSDQYGQSGRVVVDGMGGLDTIVVLVCIVGVDSLVVTVSISLAWPKCSERSAWPE